MIECTRRLVSTSSLAILTLVAACAPAPQNGEADAGPGPTGIRYLAGGDESAGFARAMTVRNFSFPDDHAPHPDYRTEWWYFTGNLFDSMRRHYGFELTIFRIALRPDPPARESTLATGSIWMAHLTVTDTAERSFQVAERLSRGARRLAGFERNAGARRIFVEDFAINFVGDTVALSAHEDRFGLELQLTGLEHIVRQGNAGLDAKGPEPGNASYYFSAPRLSATGEIRSGGADAVAVTGTAWMDREWSTSALSSELSGWDWFALQLDDGRDLMFYRLRGRDGTTSPYSGGSIADADGNVTRLDADALALDISRRWTSPTTGVRYPVEWTLSLPAENLELEVRPRIDNQELDVSVRYWEGAVSVSGNSAGVPVQGVGYLELAGY